MIKNIFASAIVVGAVVLGIGNIYIQSRPEINYKKIDGKRVALLGDSLIEGYQVEEGGLDYFLKEQAETTSFINNSKSGSTITDNSEEDNTIFINQVKSLEETPDIILFDGGINDVIGYAKGFLSESEKKDIGEISLEEVIEEDSVMNDFEEAIIVMKEKFPDAKLAYINLCLLNNKVLDKYLNVDFKREELEKRKKEFFKQIQILCRKYHIAYLDLSGKFDGKEEKYHQDDFIHLNSEGYRYITNDILEYLNTL